MQTNQNWVEAYKEICALIKDPTTGVAEITHVDMDYEQLNNESTEYPIPTHSVFMAFNATAANTIGQNVQDLDMLIDFTYAYKSLADTHDGSDNQSSALLFGDVILKLHALLQGKSGVNFSALDRISGPVKAVAPPYFIAYKMTYKCIIRDYSALKEYDYSKSLNDRNITLDVSEGATPPNTDPDPMFTINM